MDLGLTGKVALITGGSEGIGKATALRLVTEGAKVVIAARRQDVLLRASGELTAVGGQVLAVPTDVSKLVDVERLIDETLAHFGRLDIVVNNAGTMNAKPFEDASDALWQEDLDLKLFAAVRVVRAALPALKKQGGRVVNVLGIAAKQPAARSFPTSVSRAAGAALTKALSKEFAEQRILVNTVCVGLIKSAQQERHGAARGLSPEQHYEEAGKGIPLKRVGEACEVANVIAFLASEAASYVTGTSINVDGGMSAVL